jgi:hypothetical protein
MALSDILSSLISSTGGSNASSPLLMGQTAGAIDPGQTTQPGASAGTPVSELVVQAKRRAQPQAPSAQMVPQTATDASSLVSSPNYNPAPSPTVSQTDQSPQGAGLNYNNSDAVRALTQAERGDAPQSINGGNPGLYGLLPQNLQHGTLRNVLGALGDAMLVGAGRQPSYADSMGRQQVGNAMAGVDYNDPASVSAAMQRVAATGAPGSIGYADSMQKNYNDVQLKMAQQQSLNAYRDSMVDAKTQTVRDQQAMYANRFQPQIGGILNSGGGTKDAATYGRKWDSLVGLAKQIGGPNADPSSVFGLPAKEVWQPGMTDGWGMTANNDQMSQDRSAQRAQSNTNNVRSTGAGVQEAGIRAGASIQSAKINAASHPQSEAGLDSYLASRITAANSGGPPLTAGEISLVNKRFTPGRTQRPLLISPTGGGGTTAPGGAIAPHGPIGGAPQGRDIAYLRSHPNLRAQFDAHFGPGTSARILGH